MFGRCVSPFLLEPVSIVDGALQIGESSDEGMVGGEFLQTWHPPGSEHGGSIGLRSVSDDGLRLAMPLHRLVQKSRCGLSITALCEIGFERFAFAIDGAPKVMGLAVYPHKHHIRTPSPMEPCTKAVCALSSDPGTVDAQSQDGPERVDFSMQIRDLMVPLA